MPLPTEEQIRERAIELFMARLPKKERAIAPTPEDYELREVGLWYEAQRELMMGERRKIEEELARFEELAEPEKVELRQRIEAFDIALEDLKRLMEETEEKLKAPPPKVEVKARFTIGEKVKHDIHGEGAVRAVRWNEEKKIYEALVEFGGKKIWVGEPELWKIVIEKPPAPPAAAVRVPRAPAAPRAPPAPPKTIEELVKEFPKPLERAKWVTMIRPVRAEELIPRSEWTQEQRNYYEMAGVTPTREIIKQEIEEVEVPEWLNIFVGREGDFYYVKDYRLVPTTREGIYEHVRRALRPITPAPRRAAPPLFKPMWPFKGGPAFPEIKRGMTDTEIKENFSKRGITLTDDGLKFFKQRYGLEG